MCSVCAAARRARRRRATTKSARSDDDAHTWQQEALAIAAAQVDLGHPLQPVSGDAALKEREREKGGAELPIVLQSPAKLWALRARVLTSQQQPATQNNKTHVQAVVLFGVLARRARRRRGRGMARPRSAAVLALAARHDCVCVCLLNLAPSSPSSDRQDPRRVSLREVRERWGGERRRSTPRFCSHYGCSQERADTLLCRRE